MEDFRSTVNHTINENAEMTTHPLQCKCANHVLSERFNLHKSHLEVSVHLCIIRPILIALDLFNIKTEVTI